MCRELSRSGLPVFQPGRVSGINMPATGASSMDQLGVSVVSCRRRTVTNMKKTTKNRARAFVERQVRKFVRVGSMVALCGRERMSLVGGLAWYCP